MLTFGTWKKISSKEQRYAKKSSMFWYLLLGWVVLAGWLGLTGCVCFLSPPTVGLHCPPSQRGEWSSAACEWWQSLFYPLITFIHATNLSAPYVFGIQTPRHEHIWLSSQNHFRVELDLSFIAYYRYQIYHVVIIIMYDEPQRTHFVVSIRKEERLCCGPKSSIKALQWKVQI